MRVIIYLPSFLFQAEEGIRDLVRSRGLGEVYKRRAYLLCKKKSELEEQMYHLWI